MYTLHWSPETGSFAPHAALEEAGAEYRLVEVDLQGGAHHSEEFLALNPRAQVPVLTLPDGTVLTESAAMMLHIADCHPEAGLFPPVGSVARARAYRWLLFGVLNLYETDCRIVGHSPLLGEGVGLRGDTGEGAGGSRPFLGPDRGRVRGGALHAGAGLLRRGPLPAHVRVVASRPRRARRAAPGARAPASIRVAPSARGGRDLGAELPQTRNDAAGPMTISPLTEFRTVCGESPMWVPAEQCLYWTDWAENKVFRHHPASGASSHWNLDARPRLPRRASSRRPRRRVRKRIPSLRPLRRRADLRPGPGPGSGRHGVERRQVRSARPVLGGQHALGGDRAEGRPVPSGRRFPLPAHWARP